MHLAVPQWLRESGQVGQFRGGTQSAGWFGCPIAIQQLAQMPTAPEARTHHREQPREAMPPAMQIREIAQQQMNQQSDPDLPTHGIGVVAEEVGQRQRLS